MKQKLDHGELSAIIRDVANTVAYGGGWDRRTVVDRQIEQKQQELRELRDQRRQANAAIETAEEELRELQQEQEAVQTQEEQFKGALWAFEQSFRIGEYGRLFEGHGRVTDFADRFGKSEGEVLELLKTRNPDLPSEAFEEGRVGSSSGRFGHRASIEWLSEEAASTPVEERRSL